MEGAATQILRSGLWLTLPPLLFSLILLQVGPTTLTPAQFNAGIPDALVLGETIGRAFVFVTPAFFSISLVTRSQRWGLGLYLVGVASYYLSYGTQNLMPDSAWSTSLIGFAGSAYTNIVWMIGLGLLGETFVVKGPVRYRPAFYICPAVVFVVLHVTHSVLYFQRNL